MVPEPIRDAQALEFPPDVQAVLNALSPQGKEQFADDMMNAIALAQQDGNLRPVQDVIDSWYRSLLFARTTSPAEEEELQREVDGILASGKPGQTLKKLREELNLHAPSE